MILCPAFLRHKPAFWKIPLQDLHTVLWFRIGRNNFTKQVFTQGNARLVGAKSGVITKEKESKSAERQKPFRKGHFP
jgi:hypothetical protein